MKHGKSPTKPQKLLLRSYRLDPGNRLIVKNTDKEMTITHRHTGTIRKIPKEKEQ